MTLPQSLSSLREGRNAQIGNKKQKEQKLMRKNSLIGCLLLWASMAMAQPAAVKNVVNSTLTLTTYTADGTQRGVVPAVFIGSDGVAVSA